jgi:hypothetical protein
MHFDFHFTAVQILWTLTFAAVLVLLVVLLGRDRVNRFPWFTTSMVLMGLRMLASRLLFDRIPPLTASVVFLTLADVGIVVSLMVVVEMARRAFGRASRIAWLAGTVVLLVIAVTIVVVWGPWPAKETVFAHSTLAYLRLMQLVAQKGDLLADLLMVALGLLVAFCGRRFSAGWRSHTQRIVLGLSTASIAQLMLRVAAGVIAKAPPPTTQEQYQRLTGLQENLFNANSVVFIVVLVWWIVCLWFDEPGAAVKADAAQPPADPPADPLDNAEGLPAGS